MKPLLPFRHEEEKTPFTKIHPLVRLILPFVFVLPILILEDVYLTFTLIVLTMIIVLIFRLNLKRIISRIKSIVPFILLITIFVPLYVGETIFFQFNIGITINFYVEGIWLAIFMFLRIFGAIFILISIISSLSYSEFIEALTKIRIIPSYFIGSLVIMLHYMPILASSNRKFLDAQEMRGKKITTYWQKLKAHAFIMGKSIVINMERSEKLYESLKMRGFSGKITFAKKNVKIIDVFLISLFLISIIILIYFIDLELLYKGVFALFQL